MKDYQKKFIEFMVQSEVLTFGDFTTKSGRKTPFFINTGNYNTGEQITTLGKYYAEVIKDNNLSSNAVVYGPAYKGIPLCITTAIALQTSYQENFRFCFNRKEDKTHGEKGVLVGHQLTSKDEVIIVEDVITAGTAIRENLPLIHSFGAKVKAIIVSVDRMERGQNQISALEEIYQEFGSKVYPIVSMQQIVDYLYNRVISNKVIIDDAIKNKISLYYEKYGV